MRVLIGLLASRKRVARLQHSTPEKLAFLLRDAVSHPVPPVVIPSENAVCQEVEHLASDPDFSIIDILPAPTNTPEDAGPYFTLGMCYAADPQTGEHDVPIHRLCVQSRMYFVPRRHLDTFRQKAEDAGLPLPISISIGV